MATVQELVTLLEPKVKGYKSFKIGKTGQTSKERFDQEYSKKYSQISEVCYSTDSKIIDHYEAQIIKHFKGFKNNDNDQDGGGEMTTSSRYIVYIVWS